ncbi:DUF348 domain-containing protein [Streptomyces clavuligerus]|nr:resuscitation-promoting factor [Streptomyces clavuligerus]AXU16605.1 resuscitation-promoting factor [Streptomyces clavuligerus]EDY48337.1 transglycosylase domain-containing protein [Streptomyces clavuligerus]MBY6304427.1 DUF348 domain-containing protein [Streptomyces clavuligerus]QCS09368.1 DUF348 domain-containing protein [Streptomyces clavuligerus]QPJ96684.1 DUF348 domain-containing protein [Streptomyces clavuligerus]
MPHPPPRDRHEPDELSEATGAGAADELILGTFRPLREPDPPPRRRQPAHRAPSGRRRAPSTTRAPDAGLRRLVPQALVIAVLAGGTAAFVAGDKAVRLTVDGRTRTLHTFADDVGELLADAGVGTGAHDRVSPATTAELTSGDAVEVRYGRPLSLTLDGRRRTLWTTARTVGDALRLLAVPTAGARLSAPGSRPIPRSGLALDVRTERTVTFRADGRTHSVRTHALTVGQALSEAGILLRDEDTTSVPLDAFPRDGQNVSVLRISGAREVREESIPYEVVRVADPGLAAGTETVAQQGVPGVRRVTYELRTVDGVRREPRRIADVVVRPPVTHRVHVGTRNAPVRARTAGTGSGGSGGSDGLDWQALAHCESGGRAGAVDSSGTHGGLYQFDQGTWHSTGGSGRPQDASAAEQTYRAKRLYARRGAAPWPHCGRRLFR